MNPELRDALSFGVVAYAALVALYVALVGASSVAAGEPTRSQWPTATYLLAGTCVLLVAGWCGANDLSAATVVGVGVAPVAAALTAGLVGAVVEPLGDPIHPGFLAFFLAGTLALGQVVALVGYGIGSVLADL
ncbi:hypothetical protein NGM10_16335 (plasmid) [Halorussus salilacus]|uniref:hypothetical protein n=1 Tax=Halorussus salilacus TaxID=2953750 RepID=UPI00209F293E|nr:hypothetical protein [Halorussus salilacus]USZ69971.1 hypothetical protein NGM10_16335 [Halorussus salilacus]